MKKNRTVILTISVILAIVLIFLGLFLFTDTDNEPSVEFPENFVSITRANASRHDEYIENLGFTVSSFKQYLSDNNIIFFSGNENNSQQFRLTAHSTDFSKEIGDLSVLNYESIERVGTALLEGKYDSVVYANNLCFFEIISADTGSVQYVTIRNGEYYSLVFSDSDQVLDNKDLSVVSRVIDTLKIKSNEKFRLNSGTEILIIVISGVLMISAVAVAVIVIISFISDIKRRKDNDNYINDYIKIKRRKF